MNVQNQLESIVSKVLEERPGIFLVESHHDNQSHEFVIDGDKPLGIYDISDIGRAINHQAEELMPDENYTIDVCSPGADSDLKLIRQYPKHIGREFNVILDDETKFKGKLADVKENTLTFTYFAKAKPKKNEEPELKTVQFNQIKKAHIILSFK